MKLLKTSLRDILGFLTKPVILFWILPFLMVLVIAGTLAQKELGIYMVQEKYFAAWIAWIGPFPFPGGILLIGLFFINLTAKFLFDTRWSLQKVGSNIAHLGILVLIFGGLVSSFVSKEGYLVLEEGKSKAYVEDYYDRALVIRNADEETLVEIPHAKLHTGLTITDPKIPFTLTLTQYCYNCSISQRPQNLQDGWTSPGKFMQLTDKKRDPQEEKNMTGIEFSVSDLPPNESKFLTFDQFPKPPQIEKDGKVYTVTIERSRRPLPFTVTLKKFSQSLHPGTDMAKGFTSDVTVTDNGTTWPARIMMNEPLRYKGFTLYQSSFDQSGEVPFSVLTVVENKGRLFPYLASLIISLGLIMHIGIRIYITRRRVK